MKIHRRKTVLTTMLIMLIAVFAVGCASSVTTVPITATSTTASPTVAPQHIGGAHVRVLGLWSGPEDDYNFFTFPTINHKYEGTVTIGADVVVMVNDTPAARSFMTYLAGARA